MDITQLRTDLGLTQAKFAELLGVSPGHIGDLERGHRKLSLRLAAKLSDVTGRQEILTEAVAARTAERV